MAERIISVSIHWSDPDPTTGARTLLGVTPHTRNDDDTDPAPVFVPVARMNPQFVTALQNSALPGLLAARAAQQAALLPPDQAAAQRLAMLTTEIADKTAQIAALDAQIAAKQTQVTT